MVCSIAVVVLVVLVVLVVTVVLVVIAILAVVVEVLVEVPLEVVNNYNSLDIMFLYCRR